MYVRKKRNRSGSTSVVVVSKAKGYYEEIRCFGTAKTEEDIARLCSEARHWLNTNGGQQSIDFEDLKGQEFEETRRVIGNIKDNTTTPGLSEAKEKLRYLQMTDAERHAYDRHIDNIMIENDIMETKVIEGLEQGRAEGRAEGRVETARRMKVDNMPVELIAKYTGLSIAEIMEL